MKRLIPILAILIVFMFASDGWAPPPSGGGGSGIPIRKVQDLLDVTKPLSPANGEGLLYGTDANKFFATDIQTAIEAAAQDAAFYDSSESAVFSGVKVKAGVLNVDVTSDFATTVVFNGHATMGGVTATEAFNMGAYGLTNTGPITGATTGAFSGTVGVGAATPKVLFHVQKGAEVYTGSQNVRVVAEFENDSSFGTIISIVSPSSGVAGFYFGDPATASDGQLVYDHDTGTLKTITGQVATYSLKSTLAEYTLSNGKVVIKGSAGQTLNPLEIQASAGTVLFAIDKDGNIPTVGTITTTPQSAEAVTNEGTIAYDDGTDWSNNGEGWQGYRNGAWVALAPLPSFASIYADNVTVVINTTNTDTLATSGWTLSETDSIAYNSTTGIFTIGVDGAGVYDVDFSVSVSGQSNASVHYHLHAAGAGVPAVESHRKLSGNDVGNSAMSNLVRFAVGDTIKVMTQQDTGTTNQLLEHGSFNIFRVSPQ